MNTRDRDTTVIRSGGASNASWFIAGAIVVALIAGGFFYMNGGFANDDELAIKLEVPGIN